MGSCFGRVLEPKGGFTSEDESRELRLGCRELRGSFGSAVEAGLRRFGFCGFRRALFSRETRVSSFWKPYGVMERAEALSGCFIGLKLECVGALGGSDVLLETETPSLSIEKACNTNGCKDVAGWLV